MLIHLVVASYVLLLHHVGSSCPQIRTHMPPCSYTPRLSSSGSYTILPSDSADNESSSISKFSYCLPEKRSNGGGKTFCSAALYTSSYDEDLAEAPSHAAEEKIGVLLLNLGGPETLNDVQPFLFNLFADPVCFPWTVVCLFLLSSSR